MLGCPGFRKEARIIFCALLWNTLVSPGILINQVVNRAQLQEPP